MKATLALSALVLLSAGCASMAVKTMNCGEIAGNIARHRATLERMANPYNDPWTEAAIQLTIQNEAILTQEYHTRCKGGN